MRRGILVQAGLALALTGATATPRPFSYTFKSKFADVDFSWSSEAAAVPALVKRFSAELAKARSGSISCGKEESAVRGRTGSDGIACSSSTKVATRGETARLLSLSRADWAFTGGAHGNGATTGLLWDRRLNKQISFASLFAAPSGYAALLRPRYCKALDAARKEKRGSDYQPGGVTEFDTCPKFSDLALIPVASRTGGLFDEIHLIAAPYVAGPYAEGEYDIALPVTRPLIAAMKREYRASFSAQRQ